MSSVTEVRVSEPLVSVGTRVSWGALLAGAVVALAIYSVLTMLGVAIGFTVSDRVETDQLGIGAAIWTFVSLLIAMFFGGWVSTRCTAGELATEAMLYGVIVWAITSTLLIPLTAAGVAIGGGTALADRRLISNDENVNMMPAMVNASRIGQKNDASADSSSTRSDRSDASATSSRETNRDSDRSHMTQRDRENARTATWWAFAGTLLSLLAAVGGALVGPHVVITHRKYVTPRRVATTS